MNQAVEPKSRTQKRGLERRKLLVDTAKRLLDSKDISELSLADLAKESDIPLSSIYHFYPHIHDVYAALTQQFGEQLAAHLLPDMQPPSASSWMALLDQIIEGCAFFYQQHDSYAQLILSGKAPFQIKQTDRRQDNALAQQFVALLSNYFEFPRIPDIDTIVFNAVEIVDLMLSLDYTRNARLTEAGIEEAKRAGKAYLRSYLPEYLPLR